jgi:predicted alpha/beta superfamily hydrolase
MRLVCMIIASVIVFWPNPQEQPTPNAAQQTCTATGDLEIRDFKSKVFLNTRKLRVLLPAGYREMKNARRTYPVLYLNDGQDLFDVCTAVFQPMEWQADETAVRMIAEGKMEPIIIVGIDNPGKHERPNEYLPFPDDTLKPYMANPHGTEYPKFLTTEVMPFIEQNYRVKKGPKNTGLGGSSYGGLITFYTALHTKNIFGRVLIESPSLDVMNFEVLRQAEHHTDWPERVYFGGGTDEDPPGASETIPGDIEKAVRVLEADGVDRKRILVNITSGHHNEEAWAKRLPAALAFLFPPRAPLANNAKHGNYY